MIVQIVSHNGALVALTDTGKCFKLIEHRNETQTKTDGSVWDFFAEMDWPLLSAKYMKDQLGVKSPGI